MGFLPVCSGSFPNMCFVYSWLSPFLGHEFPLRFAVKTLCANAEMWGLTVELKLAFLINPTNSVPRGALIDGNERSDYWFL